MLIEPVGHGPKFSRRAVLRGASGLFFSLAVAGSSRADTMALNIVEVAPGVYVHQGHVELQSPTNLGDMSNAGFVVGDVGVAVIDTLGSAKMGAALRAAIRSVTDKPIVYVINTHMHPDHVFGNAAFLQDNATFVGHRKLAAGLLARADSYLQSSQQMMGAEALQGTQVITPSLDVFDHHVLDLGGRQLTCRAQPTAHTDNDLIVTDSKTGVTFLGDLLFDTHIPTIDGSARGWLQTIDKLQGQSLTHVVPGHGEPLMKSPEAFNSVKRYLQQLITDVKQDIQSGKSMADSVNTAGLSEQNRWDLFEQYHKRNVTAVYAEIEWE